MDMQSAEAYLEKWAGILRLRDWDIRLQSVDTPWRKTADIKIDQDNHNAILLVNCCNPKTTDIEALIVHELLHLRLWSMDQMIETLINLVYGEDEQDAKRDFAYTQFMLTLESTVQDLTKSLMGQHGKTDGLLMGRLQMEVEKEIGKQP